MSTKSESALGSWGFLGGIVLVAIGYFFLSEQTQSVVYDLVAVAAALAMGIGVFRRRPDRLFAWALLCLGIGLWAAGDIVYGTSQPVPSLADVFYISAYPVLGLGVVGLVSNRPRRWHESAFTDAVIVAAGVGVIAVVFLVAPAGHEHGVGLAGRIVSLGYPLMDLALLAGMVRPARATGPQRTVFFLLALALGLRALADTAYALQDFGTAYSVGSPVDAAFLVSYGFLGSALLHPCLAPIRSRAPAVRTPEVVLVQPSATSPVPMGLPPVVLRLRVVLGWAGLMLLGLAASALFLAASWRAPGVMPLAGAYGMTGSLMLIGSAVRA